LACRLQRYVVAHEQAKGYKEEEEGNVYAMLCWLKVACKKKEIDPFTLASIAHHSIVYIF
jgi:hypothetical protein